MPFTSRYTILLLLLVLFLYSTEGGEEDDSLSFHNKLRAIHEAPPMKLNSEMSAQAKSYAQVIGKLGSLKHSSVKDGENLAYKCSSSSGEAFTMAEATEMWYAEVCNPGYNFDTGKFSGSTGHFTQVTWIGSTELGIGQYTTQKPGQTCTYVVGRYRPPGNYEGAFQENVKKGSFNKQETCKKLKDMLKGVSTGGAAGGGGEGGGSNGGGSGGANSNEGGGGAKGEGGGGGSTNGNEGSGGATGGGGAGGGGTNANEASGGATGGSSGGANSNEGGGGATGEGGGGGGTNGNDAGGGATSGDTDKDVPEIAKNIANAASKGAKAGAIAGAKAGAKSAKEAATRVVAKTGDNAGSKLVGKNRLEKTKGKVFVSQKILRNDSLPALAIIRDDLQNNRQTVTDAKSNEVIKQAEQDGAREGAIAGAKAGLKAGIEAATGKGGSEGETKTSGNFAQMGLMAHNEFRKIHGVPEMSLDEQMSKDAEEYAKKLFSLGKLEHSKERNQAGENLASACGPGDNEMSAAKATEMWYSEVCKPGYVFGQAEPGSGVTGHFTQVVWKGSNKLGMGRASGKKGDQICTYVVGRYLEAGNMQGKYEENVPKGQFTTEICSKLDDMVKRMEESGNNENGNAENSNGEKDGGGGGDAPMPNGNQPSGSGGGDAGGGSPAGGSSGGGSPSGKAGGGNVGGTGSSEGGDSNTKIGGDDNKGSRPMGPLPESGDNSGLGKTNSNEAALQRAKEAAEKAGEEAGKKVGEEMGKELAKKEFTPSTRSATSIKGEITPNARQAMLKGILQVLASKTDEKGEKRNKLPRKTPIEAATAAGAIAGAEAGAKAGAAAAAAAAKNQKTPPGSAAGGAGDLEPAQGEKQGEDRPGQGTAGDTEPGPGNGGAPAQPEPGLTGADDKGESSGTDKLNGNENDKNNNDNNSSENNSDNLNAAASSSISELASKAAKAGAEAGAKAGKEAAMKSIQQEEKQGRKRHFVTSPILYMNEGELNHANNNFDNFDNLGNAGENAFLGLNYPSDTIHLNNYHLESNFGTYNRKDKPRQNANVSDVAGQENGNKDLMIKAAVIGSRAGAEKGALAAVTACVKAAGGSESDLQAAQSKAKEVGKKAGEKASNDAAGNQPDGGDSNSTEGNKNKEKPKENEMFGKQSNSQFAEAGLKAHNIFRQLHGTDALKLNSEMSRKAEEYAKRLVSFGRLEHASPEERDNNGENLAYSCVWDKNELKAEEAVLMWYEEVCKPGYTFGAEEAPSGTLHFTQAIWKETTELGMGKASGEKKGMLCTYVVGRYKIAGNMGGKYQENVPQGDFSTAKCGSLKDMIKQIGGESTKRTVPVLGPSLTADQTEFLDQMLEAHNDYREIHNAYPLQYDDHMIFKAQKYAETLARRGTLAHEPSITDGENLGMKCQTPQEDDPNGSFFTTLWYKEVCSPGYNFANGKFDRDSGHFSQVVWKDTKLLGVGLAKRTIDGVSCEYVVARYHPPGNIEGSFIQNVLQGTYSKNVCSNMNLKKRQLTPRYAKKKLYHTNSGKYGAWIL